ncbi:MAG: hypothetical protein CMM78_03425 [Rhodospirillaceae bacterium]|jgi:hypothetical protein|uniref:DUF6468 domain-containing protein n=1 Tax=unclassified Hwanghaeella TaxID=2605944 RepID=UPI000C532D2F|nr:hypothetical protein [Rhodospirillales bacterium]MAX47237.1 hypothetical protein [Rhodospirillaceae bacterium]|tara:strand:+ start:56661 stop:57302 length:642 start_codon:yes stop_codon:yes gene_type:complete
MIGTVISIGFDVALMICLGVAIYYGVRLNRQMAIIRSGREELQSLITEFTQATSRAETALSELKSDVGATLNDARQSAHKASALCDDLEFLIKRGEKVADALEIGVRASRKGSADPASAEARSDLRAAPDQKLGAKPSSRAAGEASLKDSLKKGMSRAIRGAHSDTDQTGAEASGRSLVAAPEDRVAAGEKSDSKKARAKSKSELLKALQDMR